MTKEEFTDLLIVLARDAKRNGVSAKDACEALRGIADFIESAAGKS